MRQLVKSMIFLLMVLVCPQGIANGSVQEKTIWKIFPIDKQAVLISDDYQIWLLHGLQPNKLTWNEWVWRVEVQQPDASYFFDVKKWKEGNTISIIYSPWHDCEWKDTYRHDTSLLQYCDYVIENGAYNARVFAKPLQIDEWHSLYTSLRKDACDLAERGFYGHAAKLLEQELVFVSFSDRILTELKNKIEGKPFDEKYIIFNEIYDLCRPVNSQ